MPGAEYDGKTIISYKEAMSLPDAAQVDADHRRGSDRLEFGYFYNAIGTKVTVVEMLDTILPGEDEEVSKELQKSLTKRGITIYTKSKTTQRRKTAQRRQSRASRPRKAQDRRGRRHAGGDRRHWATSRACAPRSSSSRSSRSTSRPIPRTAMRRACPDIYAVGDVIGPPWLAHVAHHEAICCIERSAASPTGQVDYTTIPGCTYTDPGVASVGLTEKAPARRRVTRSASASSPSCSAGARLASDETEGFVKLVFDAKYGELLVLH